jgi:hypothetical protein
MDIHALIEKFVVEQITSIGLIPTRQELLSKFKIPDTKLKEIDSQYRVLEHVWNFDRDRTALFLYKIAESDPKPTDFQGLMYLVAQTELEDATSNLKPDQPQ